MSLIFNNKIGFFKKTALVSSLTFSVLVKQANAAEQEWWFDVEVILFDRHQATDSVSEKFRQSSLLANENQALDLFTPYLTPDLSFVRAGLPFCRASRIELEQQKHQEKFAFPEPEQETELDPEQKVESAEQRSSSIHDNELTESSTLADTALDTKNQDLPQQDTDQPSDDNFEYQVVSSDIFSDNQSVIDTNQAVNKESNQTDQEILKAEGSDAEVSVLSEQKRAPMHDLTVDWIEWQAPQRYPCVYAEQVEPSLLSYQLYLETVNQDPLEQLSQMPVEINGVEWQQKQQQNQGSFLLPKDLLRMQDLYQSIKKQKDIEPLLHTSWRQKVTFGAENAQSYRLFAGKNYASEFAASGLRKAKEQAELSAQQPISEKFYIPDEELRTMSTEQKQTWIASHQNEDVTVPEGSFDLFTKIEQALNDNSDLSTEFYVSQQVQPISDETNDSLGQLWQIDGNIKVYLKNVGRVPYLHIDSNLDYRKPVFDPNITTESSTTKQTSTNLLATDELTNQLTSNLDPASSIEAPQTNFIQSANFNQLRRVISKQVHYFDHPLFGMIVRIHRYKWPVVEETDQSSEE
ncbi:peptidoglycan binding protein CsiV [Paraglaciecola aquimarina]|uniref:Peptidoglycan binding protein CsiV n=1 Tax=Paraglaciecola algarum TaxID=3050085 RepID=A0ABS9D263_9ALTE|nr:CsiV family protein [Paraglaciecola sp. G1-23]MCF2946996.1 peptidoglycan binding protein CsiV [Paraglaciecola sp. G1-23]